MSEFLQFTLSGIISGAIYALVGLGFSLIYRVSGVMNLAQGQFYAWAAFITYSLTSYFHLQIGVAVVLSVVAVAMLGILMDRLALAPARSADLTALLIITLGISTLLEGLSEIIWGTNPLAPPAFGADQPFRAFGIAILPQDLWVIGGVIVIVLCLSFILTRTYTGKALTAVSEKREAAMLMGIDASKTRIIAFAASATVGGIAGILAGPITFVTFESGLSIGLKGFVAAVLGGVGNPFGAVVGGLLLGLAESYSSAYVSSLFSSATAFVVLLLFLLIRSLTDKGSQSLGSGSRPAFFAEFRLPSVIISVALAFLVAGVAISGNESYMSVLLTAGIFAIAAIGLHLLKGITGVLSLGQGAFMAIGGFCVGVLTVKLHVDPLFATVVAIVLGMVTAAIIGFITLRLSGYILAIATLALSIIVEQVALGWQPVTGGASGIPGIPSFSAFGFVFSGISLYLLVWALVVVSGLVAYNLARSNIGRALKVIRQDETVAATSGIPVALYKVIVFVIAGALASLAGALYAFSSNFIEPGMVGSSTSILLLVMVTVGGETVAVGSVVGAVILMLLPAVFNALSTAELVLTGFLLVLVMLFLPNGIIGSLEEVYQSFSHRKKSAKEKVEAVV